MWLEGNLPEPGVMALCAVQHTEAEGHQEMKMLLVSGVSVQIPNNDFEVFITEPSVTLMVFIAQFHKRKFMILHQLMGNAGLQVGRSLRSHSTLSLRCAVNLAEPFNVVQATQNQFKGFVRILFLRNDLG